MTESAKIDLLKVAKVEIGHGLKAIRTIAVGEVCLQETPYVLAPISLEGLYARFLALTDDELRVLAKLDANVFALSQIDEDDIAARVPLTSPFFQGFRWFVALMKCNGHGLAHESNVWAIYQKAVRANHSCAPNMSYRNENGVLTYVAIRAIAEGEEATVSYIDGLYSSQRFRANKLLRQKLFLCECKRCQKEVDPLRRIWCPHCRTKNEKERNENGDGKPTVTPAFATFVGPGSGLKHLPQFQLTKQANAAQFSQSDEWWMCTSCGMTYNSAVLPVAVETTLEALFIKLDSNFASPDPTVWLNYLLYLYKTSLMVLGPMHWLLGACFFLFSRFYAGVWNGGGGELKHRDLALDHANKFFEFVEAVAKEAEPTDVLPWASVAMRLALGSGQLEKFTKLARTFLSPLRTLYGREDVTVKAYEDALQYLYAGGLQESDHTKLLESLKSYATRSVRPLADSGALKKFVPRSERIWLKPHKLQFDWTVLESEAGKRSLNPWAHPKPPPPKFLEFAQRQLAVKRLPQVGAESTAQSNSVMRPAAAVNSASVHVGGSYITAQGGLKSPAAIDGNASPSSGTQASTTVPSLGEAQRKSRRKPRHHTDRHEKQTEQQAALKAEPLQTKQAADNKQFALTPKVTEVAETHRRSRSERRTKKVDRQSHQPTQETFSERKSWGQPTTSFSPHHLRHQMAITPHYGQVGAPEDYQGSLPFVSPSTSARLSLGTNGFAATTATTGAASFRPRTTQLRNFSSNGYSLQGAVQPSIPVNQYSISPDRWGATQASDRNYTATVGVSSRSYDRGRPRQVASQSADWNVHQHDRHTASLSAHSIGTSQPMSSQRSFQAFRLMQAPVTNPPVITSYPTHTLNTNTVNPGQGYSPTNLESDTKRKHRPKSSRTTSGLRP